MDTSGQATSRHRRAAATILACLFVTSTVGCNSEKAIAERGVRAAGRKLKGGGNAALPFDYIIWYGAVDIDRKHIAIWAMLGGEAEKLLPPYMGFRNGAPLPEAPTRDGYRPAPIDSATMRTIDEMRHIIEAELQQAGRGGLLPWVGFEAESRVARAGGAFHYFK